MGTGNDCLNTISLSQRIRVRIDKWDFMKFKKTCISKGNNKQPTKYKKFFARYLSDLYIKDQIIQSTKTDSRSEQMLFNMEKQTDQ